MYFLYLLLLYFSRLTEAESGSGFFDDDDNDLSGLESGESDQEEEHDLAKRSSDTDRIKRRDVERDFESLFVKVS